MNLTLSTIRQSILLCLTIAAVVSTTMIRAEQGIIAIRGATVETMSKAGRIDNATIILKDGKIQSVGTDLAIPDTAKVLDYSGKTVLPGIVDPYRVIQIGGGNNQPTTRTVTFRGRTFTVPVRQGPSVGPFIRVADSYYPYGDKLQTLLRSGVTQMNLVTNGHGQSATARVTPKEPDARIGNPDGMIYLSVSNSTSSLAVLRNGLSGSNSSRRSSSSRGASQGGPSTGSRRPGGSSGSSTASRELWQKVLKGETPIIINVNNAAAILHMMKVLKPHKDVKVVLVTTGANLYPALESIKNRNVTLILRPTIDLIPNSQNRINIPRLVNESNIDFAFSLSVSTTDMAASQDAPLFPVAYLVKTGLKRDVALAALTTQPAKILGIEKTHGSIEPGKSADLLVFTGDPLDPTSQLSQVMIQGGVVYED